MLKIMNYDILPQRSITLDLLGIKTLVARDSMLSGLEERSLSDKGTVKVGAFPGSTIDDLRKHYIHQLLEERPSTVIIHAVNNDASQGGANVNKILNAQLDRKVEIENENRKM